LNYLLEARFAQNDTLTEWSKFKNAARSYFNQGVIELRVQDYQPRMKLGRVTKRKFIEDKKKGPIASRLDAAMGPSKASYEMPSFDDDTAERMFSFLELRGLFWLQLFLLRNC
jgi:hypothetical protein